MNACRRVEFPIISPIGTSAGSLRISLLPRTDERTNPAPLVDLRGLTGADPSLEPIQLLEGIEYRYEIELNDDLGPLQIEPSELFYPDTAGGHVGRLRPGLRIGSVAIEITASAQIVGTAAFEVRSRKFGYLDHYRWMLRDLAESMTEVMMERFSAAEQRFTIDEQRDALTLYQRFALLRSLLEDDHLQGAIFQVMSRPYITWDEEREIRPTARGVRSSSQAIRELTRPGPRRPWRGGPPSLSTIPRQVEATKSFSTTDNPPNRFIKFALTRWQNLVARIHEILASEANPSAPIRRGIKEAANLQKRLEEYLGHEFFRDVGSLTHVPASNQVLQKRAGYRAIYQAYIQIELASKLTWVADDVYGAGQRDVATLYEYWTFLQLLEIVASLCERNLDISALFTVQNDGLSLGLRSGAWIAFDGIAQASGGRRMKLELHFNKTFSPANGSWTRSMRPDCSLRIAPLNKRFDFEEVWLHFDAKYRVDALDEVFHDDDSLLEPSELILGSSKRADLLKMHAYRDAIRRSAGAYILYPGSQDERLQEFHEILPGLGAFPLCPSSTGLASGAPSLKKFIRDILHHLSSQLTQYERGRYWLGRAFDPDQHRGPLNLPPAPFLPRPPADTLVLLGFVKNKAHLDWVHDQGLYNLRADPDRRGSVGLGGRELASDLVILYGPHMPHAELWRTYGEPRLLSRTQMIDYAYPSPRGAQYFALTIEPIHDDQWPHLLPFDLLAALQAEYSDARQFGAPITLSWLTIALAITPI